MKTINTTIQNRINHIAHVTTAPDRNSTQHASKQALYNRMFNAQNYTRYTPNGTETAFELLKAYNVHVAITRYRLKRIGNANALELLNNVNHTVNLEDLQSEVLLKFVEMSGQWTIDQSGSVTFEDDTAMIEIFRAVDNYLYRFQTKHYKHQYIELDGEIVDVNKVTALADHVSIDAILEDVVLQDFMNKLPDLDREWLWGRLYGGSNRQIAMNMGVTYEKVRAIEKRVRRFWAENNAQ